MITAKIEVDAPQSTKSLDRPNAQIKERQQNLNALRDGMEALSRATNHVPLHRLEWLAIAYVASSTVGNIALLGIAIALLKGH